MVKGFESFKTWFHGFEAQYTIIGGTACDVLMNAAIPIGAEAPPCRSSIGFRTRKAPITPP